MRILWDDSAWRDYVAWQGADRKLTARINRLIQEAMRHPGVGVGKPERLKGELSGWWSRRITDEHRLVYRTTAEAIEIASCRYHYGE